MNESRHQQWIRLANLKIEVLNIASHYENRAWRYWWNHYMKLDRLMRAHFPEYYA